MLSVQLPLKEVDIDFLVFVQRYVTDLLKWDILSLFAHNPEAEATITQIANHVGRSSHTIQADVGDLTLLGILGQQKMPNEDATYYLTEDHHLRRMMRKFAEQLSKRT